jgi:hypothetical protein
MLCGTNREDSRSVNAPSKKKKFGKFGVYYIWYQSKVTALGPQGKAKISLVHFILLKKTNKNDSCYKQFFFVMF